MNAKNSRRNLARLFTEARKLCDNNDSLKLRDLIDSLEQSVSQQTSQLTELNNKLKREANERKVAELTARRQAEELAKSQRAAHVGSWCRDHIAHTVLWSDEAYRIFGFSQNIKPMPLDKFFKIVHPADIERIKRASEPNDNSPEFSVLYRVFRASDQVERWISSHGVFVRNKQGRIIKTDGVLQDITDIAEAREGLRQSEDNFRRLLGEIGDGFWEWDIKANEFILDRKASDTLGIGFSTDRITYNEIRKIIHPADLKHFTNALKNTMKSDHCVFNISHRIKNRSGKYLWLLNRAVLRRDVFGKPVRLLGYLENLEQSLRYDEIKERLEFQQKLLDSIPIPIYYKDVRGNRLGQNAEFEKQVPKRTIKSKLNELFFKAIDEAEKKLIKQRREQIVQHLNATGPDNAIHNVLLHKALLTTPDGKPEYIVGAIMDITNLKETERKLKETTLMLNTTLNSMREMLLIFDSSLKLNWANNVARNVLGKLPKRRKWNSIWIEARTITGQKPQQPMDIFRSGKPRIGTLLKLGDERIFELSHYPVKDTKGNINALLEVALDVTSREKAKEEALLRHEELIENDKLRSLGTLVAGVAHEINNPNNFMSINCSVLEKIWKTVRPVISEAVKDGKNLNVGMIRPADINDTVSELLDGMRQGAQRIRAIVDNLKDYARQQPPGNITVFNLNDALKNASFLMANMLRKSSVNVSCKYAKKLPLVKANQQRLEQVIVNVLQNACQALENNQQSIEICSKTTRDRSESIIEIRDQGIGIDPDDLAHITDPFFTTKRDSGGTGLGLSISSSILKEHLGRLEINSKKNRGCTVRIILPAVNNTEEEKKHEPGNLPDQSDPDS